MQQQEPPLHWASSTTTNPDILDLLPARCMHVCPCDPIARNVADVNFPFFFSLLLPPLGLVALAPHLLPVDGHHPSPIITLSYTLPGIATGPWAVEKKRAERAAWCGCVWVRGWFVSNMQSKDERALKTRQIVPTEENPEGAVPRGGRKTVIAALRQKSMTQ